MSDWGIPTVVTSHCRYLFPVPASNGCNAQGSRASIEMKAVRASCGEGRQGILLESENREEPCIFLNSLPNTWLRYERTMAKWRVDGRERVGNKTAAYERVEIGWR